MGKHRRIPTISGGEPKTSPFYEAEILQDGDDAVLDLHGMTKDEARAKIDLFLDRMVASGAVPAKIVHGKGQGTLAMLVRDLLGRDARVKRFQPSLTQMGAAVVIEMET